MRENDIGPQKGPASTTRIEAQAKAIRNELEQLPKIKPLVWESYPLEDRGIRARSPLGAYRCMLRCTGRWMAWEEPSEWFSRGAKHADVDTEEEAKAWCQDEYERRVRECLG